MRRGKSVTVIDGPTSPIELDEIKVEAPQVLPGPLLPRNRPPTAPQREANVTPIRRPGPKDIATLEVRGQLFTNWTSVRVEQRWTEAFPVFQFDCSEEIDIPLTVSGLQFQPGDVVRVFLGGHDAVFGYITERHVGFDAQNHGVRLIGTGDTADLTNSAVPLDKLGGHDGQSVHQLAQSLSEHLGIQIHRRGAVDDEPYQNIQVQPGETPMSVIERYARPRNIVIGSEANGGLLLIGEHEAITAGHLWESVHILRANCVIRDDKVYHQYFAVGQNKGSDDANGDPENKQVAQQPGSSSRNRHSVVVMDVADKTHGVERRVLMEQVFSEGSHIEAQITVQGWFKDNNASEDIWRAGEYYSVYSPSLILYDEILGCAGCVYEQDDQGGTTTTLQLVRPIHMNGKLQYRAESMIYLKKQRERDLKAAADAKAEAEAKAKEEATE